MKVAGRARSIRILRPTSSILARFDPLGLPQNLAMVVKWGRGKVRTNNQGNHARSISSGRLEAFDQFLNLPYFNLLGEAGIRESSCREWAAEGEEVCLDRHRSSWWEGGKPRVPGNLGVVLHSSQRQSLRRHSFWAWLEKNERRVYEMRNFGLLTNTRCCLCSVGARSRLCGGKPFARKRRWNKEKATSLGLGS